MPRITKGISFEQGVLTKMAALPGSSAINMKYLISKPANGKEVLKPIIVLFCLMNLTAVDPMWASIAACGVGKWVSVL